MPLSSETIHAIEIQVRGGFATRKRLLEIFCEEIYAPGELDGLDVDRAVDEAIAKHEQEKKAWPDVTDCDRLTWVFTSLNHKGVIAVENAGNTQSDGYSDILHCYDLLNGLESAIGYSFYHGRGLDRAVEGGGLYRAFGSLGPGQRRARELSSAV